MSSEAEGRRGQTVRSLNPPEVSDFYCKSPWSPWDRWARRKEMAKSMASKELERDGTEETRMTTGEEGALRFEVITTKVGVGGGVSRNIFRNTCCGWKHLPLWDFLLRKFPFFSEILDMLEVYFVIPRKELVRFTKQTNSDRFQYLILTLSISVLVLSTQWSTWAKLHHWMNSFIIKHKTVLFEIWKSRGRILFVPWVLFSKGNCELPFKTLVVVNCISTKRYSILIICVISTSLFKN